MAKYSYTHTPGGKQTSTANQTIDFYIQGKNAKAQFLNFQTFATECHIKLNNEDVVHWIPANEERVFQDIDIDKITIVDAGVEFYYTALSE